MLCMANVISGLDSVVKKFPIIATEARKISTALAIQEAGSCLQGGFLTYAFACHNLIAQSASLRAANKDLDAALQGLAGRVQAAYAKIAPDFGDFQCRAQASFIDKPIVPKFCSALQINTLDFIFCCFDLT